MGLTPGRELPAAVKGRRLSLVAQSLLLGGEGHPASWEIPSLGACLEGPPARPDLRETPPLPAGARGASHVARKGAQSCMFETLGPPAQGRAWPGPLAPTCLWARQLPGQQGPGVFLFLLLGLRLRPLGLLHGPQLQPDGLQLLPAQVQAEPEAGGPQAPLEGGRGAGLTLPVLKVTLGAPQRAKRRPCMDSALQRSPCNPLATNKHTKSPPGQRGPARSGLGAGGSLHPLSGRGTMALPVPGAGPQPSSPPSLPPTSLRQALRPVTWSGTEPSARPSLSKSDGRKPVSPSSSACASTVSSASLPPPPAPRGVFSARLQAPQPWASGSEEALWSQASVGGGKRARLRKGHMGTEWEPGTKALTSPPAPPAPCPLLSPPAGQLLPLECFRWGGGPPSGLPGLERSEVRAELCALLPAPPGPSWWGLQLRQSRGAWEASCISSASHRSQETPGVALLALG